MFRSLTLAHKDIVTQLYYDTHIQKSQTCYDSDMSKAYFFGVICMVLIVIPAYILRGQSQTSICQDIPSVINTTFSAEGVSASTDNNYMYIESDGMPNIPMMVGITSWQQQVPIPQNYRGDNKWVVPKNPAKAQEAMSLKNNFFKGAVGVGLDGVPIFNALNNRGEDAYLAGELDEYGGHSGRADDYHYHIAPTYINKKLGNGCPIAIMLDGYFLYGFNEPNGTPVNYSQLDSSMGHEHDNLTYHYHASKNCPYINQAMHGEVQLEKTRNNELAIVQPRTTPIRPFLQPLRGAMITGFMQDRENNSYALKYSYWDKPYTLKYSKNGSTWTFLIPDHKGNVLTETYTEGGQRGGSPQKNSRSNKKR